MNTCCSVIQSCLTLIPHGQQHARLPCPSLSPGVCSDLWPLSWWCHPTISSSVARFSFCLQSFPASGSFPMSRLFASCGQRTEASVSASVPAVNIQGWFPWGLTGLISSLRRVHWKRERLPFELWVIFLKLTEATGLAFLCPTPIPSRVRKVCLGAAVDVQGAQK